MVLLTFTLHMADNLAVQAAMCGTVVLYLKIFVTGMLQGSAKVKSGWLSVDLPRPSAR